MKIILLLVPLVTGHAWKQVPDLKIYVNFDIFQITIKNIYSVTYYTIGNTMEIHKQSIIISKKELLDILEIRVKHRLKFFSYTYHVLDKTGKKIPIVRWDNYGGIVHYDTYDYNHRLSNHQRCEYKLPSDILQIIKIFKHNLATMDISKL